MKKLSFQMNSRYFLVSFFILYFITGSTCFSEAITLDLGATGGSMISRMVQLLVTLTLLSLAPALIMMVTSFTRMVIVFSFLRTALGTQQSPPNLVIMSLSLFMTTYIMMPVFEKAYDTAIVPLMDEKITEKEAFNKAAQPFREFMLKNIREKDLLLFMNLSKQKVEKKEDVSLRVLVPAFMISELKRAFEIGFLIFIPFLIIDMVVASTLMAMGMMMLPPVMISLPFKLIFFVMIDGWNLICGSLVKSFH
ncbi:MAG: flagellar biosynthetic protein FliP [Candidatus Puniceispirillum sp.]|nr:flagellar biosynthetic protein FliP [Candidatus Pelagibacter sp.]MBA4283410.1 flagellar biosynthetic protein FliP [Candidatus Puniceispirillum sp.]